MNGMQNVDKDMIQAKGIAEENIVFYDVMQPPFDLYGFASAKKGEGFLRMPLDRAAEVSEGVAYLCKLTSGGRVRFKTDSPYVAMAVKYSDMVELRHMSPLGIMGFDMYVYDGGKYTYSNMRDFIPPYGLTRAGYSSVHYFKNREMKDIVIDFPLYNDVLEFYIGIEEGSALSHGSPYRLPRPIVYYGSSIAQGACASRPGNSYPAMISRMLDSDFVNLGFSGSAKGEESLAEYIADLHPAAFVSEYDQDASTVEALAATHKKFIDIIRKKNPDMPIILTTSILRTEWTQEIYDARKAVILGTYNEMRAMGDENVYYLDCQHVFDQFGGDNGITDGSHPNDLGFMCMAKSISEILRRALRL